MSEFAIETSELTKVFGAVTAVDKLNLRVPSRSIFGLLGPNGAGKTTTFSMICGFVRPSAGEVSVLGHPVGRFDHSSGMLSALPQDAKFHPDRSVIDSMSFLGTLSGLSPAESKRQSLDLLKRVDLDGAAGMKGAHLSHGMAKRFGIAQAFLGSPRLVLLDEPTAGLDPRNAWTIRQMVRTLAGSATVIVSSHNLAEVQDLCTHAAIINQGRLVSAGAMDELTSRDQQVIITVSNATTAILDAMAKLDRVSAVAPMPTANEIRVIFKANQDESADQAISQIIAGIIAAGGSVTGVRRGKDLEERYLEVT